MTEYRTDKMVELLGEAQPIHGVEVREPEIDMDAVMEKIGVGTPI